MDDVINNMTIPLFDAACCSVLQDNNSLCFCDRTGFNLTLESGIRDLASNGILYSSICTFSLICLFCTFLVYWLIPSFNNLHGKIVVMNIICIALETLFIIVIFNIGKITTIKLGKFDLVCTLLGYFSYFSTISMFSWMTMMSFDLGWTFTHSEAPRHSSDCHKLRLYSVLAWGLPGLLTLSLALLQALLPWHSEFSPQIGHRKCFLWWGNEGWVMDGGGHQPIYYFYIPILLLMLTNTTIFLVIVISIFVAKGKTKVARRSTNR